MLNLLVGEIQQISKWGIIMLRYANHKWGIVHLFILMFFLLYGQVKANDLSFDSYTQEHGLPNNQIQCIFQDSKGWIWLGTSQGLSRFDGYEFNNYVVNSEDSSSIRGNLVRVIYEDSKGNLLIGTENGGINRFNRDKENFDHPYDNHNIFKYGEISINDIKEDDTGNLWFGTNHSLLKQDTQGNLLVITPQIVSGDKSFAGEFIRVLKFDRSGLLWIGTDNGLFLYNPQNNETEVFDLPFGSNTNYEIWELFLDDDGQMWVGTYSAGAFIINPITRKYFPVVLTPKVSRNETVKTISKGTFGDYWIGTRGGMYIYSKQVGVKGFYRHDERGSRSLTNNSILDIFHDSREDIWIGTRGGVNLLAKSKQFFHNFPFVPSDNRYLNSSIVYAFWIDKNDRIWIGTEDGGVNIYNPKTETYEYLMADPNKKQTIAQNCVKAFLDDDNGNLWIGTYMGGIDVLNLKTGTIRNYSHNEADPSSLADDRVWDLFKDSRGNIWVGTSSGIDRYNKDIDGFEHFDRLANNQHVNWIKEDSDNNLWFGALDEIIIYTPSYESITRYPEHPRNFYEDSRHQIWIATMDKGIALYSISEGCIRYYDESHGLTNNQALCILEDNNQNLWISTSNGLSKFNPDTEEFYNFTHNDGLQNNQFTYGAAYKTKDGQLLFGGISGFNMFDPNDITLNTANVPLVFTDLRVFNKSVEVSDEPKSLLKKSISETNHITLRYDQNVFTLEFAALNYVNSANNMYTYYLEGFNTDWTEPVISREATYTNLNPDDYILRIRRVVNDKIIEDGELRLAITILPPYWRTWWFKLILFVTITALIIVLIQFFINREKIKSQLVLERLKSRKLHELDMMKLKFFTNISHEIRTPLTLILGPIEKLMTHKVAENERQQHLNVIHRNARQLDRLINQILDFRKLESGNLKLNITQSDIVHFVSEIVNSFEEFAKEKNVKLKFVSLKKGLVARFDPDKIEKIINNLLTNAFKHTNEGGNITVHLSLVFDSGENFTDGDDEKQYIEISVKDSGNGISEKQIDKIFLRFFQGGKGYAQSGIGIGLALVKELVKLHKGEVFVTSKPGKGTKFTIRIPYLEGELGKETEIQPVLDHPLSLETSLMDDEQNKDTSEAVESAKIMLIVEDNPDVRYFIKSHFNSVYKIFEAPNGREGWDTAVEVVPDVIISDIMMPDVDGYEFCKKIKNDERTSHIPVLLLTALHSKEHELKGLSYGADDYITKPFDLSVLQAKIDNMLSVRESLKEKFSGTMVLEPRNIVITSPDERFLQKAIEVVEDNISNSDLDIEQFAMQVGVSRMQLYRKLSALTDMTVKEFIRNVRLKRATQLLVQKKLTVSEVAFEVGFKDLSHFRKSFKRQFGISATEYINKNSSQN